MSKKSFKVGLLGLGTVGGGTYTVLNENAQEIERRLGFPIQVVAVAVQNIERAKKIVGDQVQVFSDGLAVVKHPEVEVVVELIGGYTVAKQLVLAAIQAGKPVVTANKALLAVHGDEIFSAAAQANVPVLFESAVAGGIPVIKALKEGLAGNQIEYVAGIINGTSNFILSEMRDKGLPFNQVLKQAQQLGYAESDPTFDIEGIDAAHKLTLLSAIAFGIHAQFNKAHIEGIQELTAQDIAFAEELGYRVKLLGITRLVEGGVELRVHPTLIPSKRLIANVEGVMNAVSIKANAVGSTLYYGPGAGALPTASSVVADLIEIARLVQAPSQCRVSTLAFQYDRLQNKPVLPMEKVVTSFYLRLLVDDKPGVLAQLTSILSKHHISIGSMIQRQLEDEGEEAQIIMLTHSCIEGDMNKALAEIETLDSVLDKVVRIRVEDLN